MLTDISSLPSKVRQFLCVTVFFFACTALILASTGQTVSIRGTVSDPSGAVVPGAKVRARNLATGAVLESTTGAEGGYAISLAAGRYDFEFSESGFQPLVRPGVEVAANTTAALDVQLHLAMQAEVLSVTVEVPGVETASSQVGETISAEKMTAVPLNGRSFTDLLAMQPGVIPSSSQQPNAVVMSGCTRDSALGRSQCGQSVGERTARNQQRLRRQ